MKKILILHTGGTFGMHVSKQEANASSASTVKLQNNSDNSSLLLNDLLTNIPQLKSIADISIKVLCNIDSSNATPKLWKKIAENITSHWAEFDGFVVIHGTDTMAWTASAIAFFLDGLTKSIVLTGSQRPLTALRNDARANMIDAVELATYGIPEVMVCFDSKVHRATRVTKYSNEHLYAFKSYNSPLIGCFGVNFKINKKIARSILPLPKRHPPSLNTNIENAITSLVCVPGMSFSRNYINSIVKSAKGIIIQGFGTGNLPTENDSWKQLCKVAFSHNIPVVMSTQCDSGNVALNLYENGKVFSDLGVIPSLDMTFEAASVKLMIMLGRKIPFAERIQFFSTPLAYECNE